MSAHPTISAFGVANDQLAIGGAPVELLAERVGTTPFFAYDRRLLTHRVGLLRTTLPDGIDLSYAVKANPMPAVVQHLSSLVDCFDVASALEMRTGARHSDARDADQLRRARQDPCRAVASRRRRCHGDPGIENGGGAGHLDGERASASGHAWLFASTRTSASRGRACGWAVGRSSSESTRSRCRNCSATCRRPTSRSSASTYSPGRRTSTPRSSARRSARRSSS